MISDPPGEIVGETTDDPAGTFVWPKWRLGKYHGAGNTFLVKLIEVPLDSLDEIRAHALGKTDAKPEGKIGESPELDLATSLEDILATNAGVLHPSNTPLKGEYLASIAEGICNQLPKRAKADEAEGPVGGGTTEASTASDGKEPAASDGKETADDTNYEDRGGFVDGLIIGLCAFPLLDSTGETNQTIPNQNTPLKVGMLLRNLDGSDGQVSGNGLRCLGHAVLRTIERQSSEIEIFTASGLRHARAVRSDNADQSLTAPPVWDVVSTQVNMGRLELFDSVTPAGDPEIEEAVKDTIRRAARAIVFTPADHSTETHSTETHSTETHSTETHSTETHSTEKGFRNAAYGTIGNPHLVIDAGDVSHALDIIADNSPNATEQVLTDFRTFGKILTYELKRTLELKHGPYPDGINVEFISAAPPFGEAAHKNAINMIVWERGVGITKACGTGAVVAAAQAAKWGLVDGAALIEVRMPGGSVRVLLPQARENDGPEPVLTGYSDYVEDHTYDFHSHELT